MVKIISVLCLTVFLFVSNNFSQINNGDGYLLYSQTDIASNQLSLPSYYYNSNDWTQIADDFTATSNWEIDQIVIVGMDADSSYSGFNINIYTNNSGFPGTHVYSAETQPYTISFITYFIWHITINLEIPANLNPGDYLISVQSSSPGSNNLYWTQVNGAYGNIAMFRSGCTSWVPVTSGICLPPSNTDMYFELWGTTTVPVELTSFSANVNDDNVELSWITATETNNQGFEIERSEMSEVKSQMEWEKIGFVDGHGTTTESQAYSFQDKNVVTGNYSYRLKQIDFDGTSEYSNVIEVEVTSPSTFSLEQNYPNPFNPSTMISYQLPISGDVTLKVYDVLGNEVETLVDEYKPAGNYKVEFNAANLPSGIYFYKLQVGSLVETKKMLLLK
jgi:hypothetical protein